jgi:hypothetical protein
LTIQPETNRLKLETDANNDNASKLGNFNYDPAYKTTTGWLDKAVVCLSQFDVPGVFLVLNRSFKL